MVTKAQSLFYYIYRATSSGAYFIFNRITPLGILFLLLIVANGIVFVTYYKLATLYLFSLLCGVLLFSIFTVFFKFSNVRVTRELPEIATIGKDLTYVIHYVNLGSTRLNSTLLHDLPVDSRPSRLEFIHAKEPKEDLRNAFDRIFVYYRWLWLCKKKTKFESKPVTIPFTEKGGEGTLMMNCKPMNRGRLEFGNARLCQPDPLYLLQKFKFIKTIKDSVIVLPKRYMLSEQMIEGISRDQVGGQSYSAKLGLSDDFRGLREYRPGDSPKKIDWASWAKTGSPVVREYEDISPLNYALVLDTNSSYDQIDRFEEAVSIAASFARQLETQECLIDLLFYSENSQINTIRKDVVKSEGLLKKLSTVEIENKPEWNELSKNVLRQSASFSICIIVFTTLCEERKELVQAWRQAGLNLLIIVLIDDEDEKQEVIELGASPVRIKYAQNDLLNVL